MMLLVTYILAGIRCRQIHHIPNNQHDNLILSMGVIFCCIILFCRDKYDVHCTCSSALLYRTKCIATNGRYKWGCIKFVHKCMHTTNTNKMWRISHPTWKKLWILVHKLFSGFWKVPIILFPLSSRSIKDEFANIKCSADLEIYV